MVEFPKHTIEFPPKPPALVAKPVRKPGEKRRMFDKYSLWGSHDPTIYRDPTSGNYYTYCTGAIARRSRDLITWETIGKVVDNPPPKAVAWTGGTDIWAPDIIKVGDQYMAYGTILRKRCRFALLIL